MGIAVGDEEEEEEKASQKHHATTLDLTTKEHYELNIHQAGHKPHPVNSWEVAGRIMKEEGEESK